MRWQPHPANPIIPYWAGDVEILTYDPIDRRYVLYGRARKWTSPPATCRCGRQAGRHLEHAPLRAPPAERRLPALVGAGHGLRGRRRRQPRRRALRLRPLARGRDAPGAALVDLRPRRRPRPAEVHDRELFRDGHHLCLATLRRDGWVSLTAGVYTGIRGDQAGVIDGPTPLDQRLLPARRVCGGRGNRHLRPAARRLRARNLPAVHRRRGAPPGALGGAGRGEHRAARHQAAFHLRDADLYGFRFEPE